MANYEEEKLQQALYRAIDLTRETGDATEAVAKTASQYGLNPKESEFLVTSYNKAKSFALGNQLDESTRASTFDIADPDSVYKKLYPETMKTAEDTGASGVSLPSLEVEKNPSTLVKNAAEKMKVPDVQGNVDKIVHDTNIADRKILDTCERITELYPKLCNEVKKTASQHNHMMKEFLYDASDEFKKYPQNRVKKVAQRIVNGFGENLGKTALDTMSAVTGREVPEVQKTASHTIFPTDRIYQHIANAQKYASKGKKASELHKELTKHGQEVRDLAETITGKTLGNQPGSDIIRKYLGVRKPEKTMEEELPADIYQKLQGLESREAFIQSILKNPSLQEYSLEGLQDAFNYAIETNPELVNSPRSLSNVMLSNIKQGNVDTIDQLSAKKDISKSDLERAKSDVERKEKEQNIRKEEESQKEQRKPKPPDVESGEKGPPEKMQELVKGVGESVQKSISGDKGEKAKEKQTKEELSQEEKDRENKQDVLKQLRGKMPLKGHDVQTTEGGKLKRARVLGLEDIPVEIGGQTTTLKPEDWVELEKADQEQGLGPKGQTFLSKVRQLRDSTGYKPIPLENLPAELKRADIKAGQTPTEYTSKGQPVTRHRVGPDQLSGLETGVSSVEELFTE